MMDNATKRTSMIAVNGHIDQSLSRGLRKRMAREAGVQMDKGIERLNQVSVETEMHWSAKRWLKERTQSLHTAVGEQHIVTVQLSKRERMMLALNADPVGGLYFIDSFLMDRKTRCIQGGNAPIALTTHFVDRYFQRIGRPFTFAELAQVARGGAAVVAHDSGLRPELIDRLPDGLVYWERGIMCPDGLPVTQSTEPEKARPAMIAKTFIHCDDMSRKRRVDWDARADVPPAREWATEGVLA
jgi:hypothetical protein